jgi:transposase, IS30 family
MSYSHLTLRERYCIFHQQHARFSNAEIGRRTGRHRATIGRELKRFRSHPSWPYLKQYLPDGAAELARERRAKPRGFYWTRHRPLLAYVLRGLKNEWSPEQIVGRLKLDHPDDAKMRVSHASIYKYVKADRAAGGSLWKRLRQSSKTRRKAYGSGPRRSRIPDRVSIDQRPAEVENRETLGHWEADTVLGTHGRLATFVERMSRYVLIARLPDGTAVSFNQGAIRVFRKLPKHARATMTADNGSEFIEHGELARRLGFKTYFADPYSSWQRGTNENTNGLIRQYFPKRHDFGATGHQRVARIARKLNNRPRKCLAYRTPAEVLAPALRFNL